MEDNTQWKRWSKLVLCVATNSFSGYFPTVVRVRIRVKRLIGKLDRCLYISSPFLIWTLKHKSSFLLHNTLPQNRAYTSYRANLLQINYAWGCPSDLVNKSASWLADDACFSSIMPSSYFSHTTRQSTSIYLVLWNTNFGTMHKDNWLSQYVIIVRLKTHVDKNISYTYKLSCKISHILSRDSNCFLFFHETRFPPQYLVIDLLSVKKSIQSTFEKQAVRLWL